jgi:cyanophycinase
MRLVSPNFKHAVILGGGGMGIDAYQKAVELVGGPRFARVGVITAAADGGREMRHAEYYTGVFEQLGCAHVEWIPVWEGDPKQAYDKDVVKRAKDLNIIFFGGGSQNRLIGVMVDAEGRDTPLLAAIKQRYADKKVIIAGDSAGAASQALGPAITSGESYEALTKPSRPTHELYNGEDLSYNPRGGLGFFPFAIDTHFTERGRQGRLVKFAAETDQNLAFGVDEGTALVVTDPLDEGKREATVTGAGGVTIFDLGRADIRNQDGFSIDGVDVAYLTNGDHYLPDSRSVKFAPWKQTGDGGVPPVNEELKDDIFGAPRVLDVKSKDAAVVSAKIDASRPNPGAFRDVALSFVAGDDRQLDATAYESRQYGNRRVSVAMLKTDWTRMVAKKPAFEHLRLDIHA